MKTIRFKDKKELKHTNLDNELLYDIYNQTTMLYQLYLDEDFEVKNILLQSINKKLQGYKQQDNKHHIYSKHHFIHNDDTIQRLVESKLKCFYCNCDLMLFYKECKQNNQWTLDRIDNSMGHNTNNVVISCLECNLKRRDTEMNKFKFTKQLNIKKIQ
tara:strand:+ start:1237 stop:1710 length:474 start_codon:yes stop_codon:yes gene_type:complete